MLLRVTMTNFPWKQRNSSRLSFSAFSIRSNSRQHAIRNVRFIHSFIHSFIHLFIYLLLTFFFFRDSTPSPLLPMCILGKFMQQWRWCNLRREVGCWNLLEISENWVRPAANSDAFDMIDSWRQRPYPLRCLFHLAELLEAWRHCALLRQTVRKKCKCGELFRWCAYDIDHIYELRIKNRSESDPRSCEAT